MPTIEIKSLRSLALQYRTLAVDALEQGNLETAEAHEQTADRLYGRAVELGDTGVQVPRTTMDQLPQGRFCLVCRRRYESTRSDAKFCSARCRQKSNRLAA